MKKSDDGTVPYLQEAIGALLNLLTPEQVWAAMTEDQREALVVSAPKIIGPWKTLSDRAIVRHMLTTTTWVVSVAKESRQARLWTARINPTHTTARFGRKHSMKFPSSASALTACDELLAEHFVLKGGRYHAGK